MVSTAQRKPEGGFQFVSIVLLCLVWQAYHTKRIQLYDVRVWFAVVELVARRCQLTRDKQPTYTCEELAQLVGRAGEVSSSLHRLELCGLVTWETHAIRFPRTPAPAQQSAELQAMLHQIPNHKRSVPVPRRLLRFIAHGCSRALLATILGHLFRCLYYHHGQCWPEGLCKASWIAQVFGVSERAVKTARHHLEAVGFLLRTETAQWVCNRYGQKMTINLHWTHSPVPAVLSPPPAITIAPLSLVSSPETAPPDSNVETLTEEKNQEPAAGRPLGILSTLFAQARECLRTGTVLPIEPEPVVTRTVSAPAQKERLSTPVLTQTPQPSPRLQHVTLPDLKDTERLLALYAQSVQAKLIGPSDAERLTFVGLAQHVLAYRPENAGGLFRQLLTRRCFHFITQEDEDAAQQRLKQHLYAVRRSPILPTQDPGDSPGIQRVAA